MNKQRVLHTVGLAVVSGLAALAVRLKDSPYWWAPAAATLAAALVVQLPKVAPSIFGPLAFALLFGAAGAGCWLTKPPPISPTVPDGGFADASAGQTLIDCSEATLHNAWVGLLPAIETGLATGNVAGALTSVGIDIAAPGVLAEVACGVQYLVSKYLQEKPLYPADSLTGVKIANGQAWLEKHPDQRPINVATP